LTRKYRVDAVFSLTENIRRVRSSAVQRQRQSLRQTN